MPFDPLPTAFGLCLWAGGVLAAFAHRRTWRRIAQRAARGELEDWEVSFHRARRRRRSMVAGLLIFLGVAIPVGDAALAAAPGPAVRPWFAAYLGVLLAAVCGMLLLAALDWVATAVHTRDRLADVYAKRAALEHAVRELRAEAARASEPPDPAPPRRPPFNRLRDYSFDD